MTTLTRVDLFEHTHAQYTDRAYNHSPQTATEQNRNRKNENYLMPHTGKNNSIHFVNQRDDVAQTGKIIYYGYWEVYRITYEHKSTQICIWMLLFMFMCERACVCRVYALREWWAFYRILHVYESILLVLMCTSQYIMCTCMDGHERRADQILNLMCVRLTIRDPYGAQTDQIS